MKTNILIVVSKSFKLIFLKKLKKDFPKVNFITASDSSQKKIIDKIYEADALINCPRKFFNNNLFKEAKRLKWAHLGGAGVEEYLFPEFISSRVTLTNGKMLQGPEMADHAIGLLLTISRNIHLHIKGENKNKIKRPIELMGKVCGILGMGGTGFLIAERLKSFGMKVVGISEDLMPLTSFVDQYFTSEKLLNLLPRLDVVICAAPFTKRTSKLFNTKHFNKMKKDSIFINISRGKIVDTKSLLNNKIYKKFRGIGLDVTDPEPLPKNHKLRKLKNVVLSNHTSGLSDQNRNRSIDLIVKNINRFLLKQPLLNIVDKQKGY